MASADQAPSMEELLNGPALEPPPNVIPDFSNPGGSHAVGYGLVLVGSIVSTIAIMIRLGSRFLLRKIGLDDAFMISAFVSDPEMMLPGHGNKLTTKGLFAGYQYVIYKHSIFPGIGVHQWNLQLKFLPDFLYDVHIASIFYGLGVMCLKVAILIDWLHIFVPQGRGNAMFWTLHILIWCNIIFYLAGNFAEIFRCNPREKIWNVFYEGGSCPVNIAAQNFSAGILNLISDVIILALPQWIIWRLNMSRARKLGISLLFVIGIFICVCATASIVWLDRMLNSSDILYCMSIRSIWGIGEWAGGFLILGIPSAPKVFQKLPFSDSVLNLIRSLTEHSASSNVGGVIPRTWGKPLSRKRRRGLWEITELETNDTVPMKSINGNDNHPPNETSSDICINLTVNGDGRQLGERGNVIV
ncbi:hypothetical protein F5Y00DRAFT_262544 [Daldinia vernicosa]|uniref:uncharacterized protein n=1 Tax=Daldinia vernicosa TaxID=114800 RepID=UPI0020082819|nr:uncharacterized protein F5Y00DRAFT_262544 [Daldinia vernicosa]KAI0848450.1 hypothetical protein F5Y00DRAFT_262544 [Daldinia vernicosa]